MEIIKNLNPILTGAAMVITLIGAGKQLWSGKFLNVLWVLLIGSALIYFIKSPTDFINIAENAVKFVSKTAGDLRG